MWIFFCVLWYVVLCLWIIMNNLFIDSGIEYVVDCMGLLICLL